LLLSGGNIAPKFKLWMVCYTLPSHSPNIDLILTEEYLTGGQHPTPHRRLPASTNKTTNINKPPFRSGSAVTSLVAAQLHTLIELASRLDNDQTDDNGPKLSMDGPVSSSKNSTESAHTGVGMDNMYLNCQMGVNHKLGELDLRIKLAECSKAPGESKHGH
jgi:hypothetical protein